uniref:DM2 domain-containing protein n=1 Tax=Xiphophorus couchianus TaxID=32473 RepID=A0A3B5LS46_9TELE
IYNPGTSVPVPPPPTTSKKMLFQTRRPVPRMIPLLHSVGVFHYVEQYIKRRRLYDEERQYLVRCGRDPLEEVFCLEGFSLRDLRHSVAALLIKLFSVVTADNRRAGASVNTTSTTKVQSSSHPTRESYFSKSGSLSCVFWQTL